MLCMPDSLEVQHEPDELCGGGGGRQDAAGHPHPLPQAAEHHISHGRQGFPTLTSTLYACQVQCTGFFLGFATFFLCLCVCGNRSSSPDRGSQPFRYPPLARPGWSTHGLGTTSNMRAVFSTFIHRVGNRCHVVCAHLLTRAPQP